jgi:hypothetical protein
VNTGIQVFGRAGLPGNQTPLEPLDPVVQRDGIDGELALKYRPPFCQRKGLVLERSEGRRREGKVGLRFLQNESCLIHENR